jgi:hypothetical protein
VLINIFCPRQGKYLNPRSVSNLVILTA